MSSNVGFTNSQLTLPYSLLHTEKFAILHLEMSPKKEIGKSHPFERICSDVENYLWL